jgi:thioredoxin
LSGVVSADGARLDAAASDNTLVIVDFWAPWCVQCKAMTGIVERLAAALDKRATVLTIDTEAYPAVAERYEVQTLPSILLLRRGEVRRRITGFKRLPAILEELRGEI